MQRFYAERETSGPEFDDSLIRLVRTNPAIYDVNHPHYRRNPVRVAIWDKIATELGAPSKFIQTKWKNIRYNYLQELKCLETGFQNANIRKRRFTEDLSFLQNTAQSYNVKKSACKFSSYNSSDNESNSYLFPEPPGDAFEIIEIDHSDDGGDGGDDENGKNTSPDNTSSIDAPQKLIITDKKEEILKTLPNITTKSEPAREPTPDVTIEHRFKRRKSGNHKEFIETEPNEEQSPPDYFSNSSSPLLMPMVIMGNGTDNETNGICDEVTIEPIKKSTPLNKNSTMETGTGFGGKKNSLHAPFNDLMPINDPIELYCLSLVDSLRSMPRSERERVKFEFAKILKDAKYKDQS